MELEKVVNYIEDKDIVSDSNWYLHATIDDIEIIRKILNEGVKCAHLTGSNFSKYNGPYYVSLFKNDFESHFYKKEFSSSIKLIITGIRPYHTSLNSRFAMCFAKTIIPIRTSICSGEYQKFLQIDPSKFVGIDYQLSMMIPTLGESEGKRKIEFLKDVTECVQEVNPELPIYDLASKKELNKDKILNLVI